QATVQGRDRRPADRAKQGVVQKIIVKMNDVEVVRLTTDFVEHHQMIWERIANMRTKPQSPFAARNEPRGRHRVSARKEGHIMSLRDELVRKGRHYTLGPAIKDRRYS